MYNNTEVQIVSVTIYEYNASHAIRSCALLSNLRPTNEMNDTSVFFLKTQWLFFLVIKWVWDELILRPSNKKWDRKL